jgi:hypothetical protein
MWSPEYDAVLIEEAVAHALRSRDVAVYWLERAKLYEIADEDRRTREFLGLARQEFERLGLDSALERALRERPVIARRAAGCLVIPANSARDEGAELFVRRSDGVSDARQIVIRLQPSSFAGPDRLLALLRHELYHIADMLDPAFGYEPVLEGPDGHPLQARILASRYRVLWDAVIDGRLVREGRAPASIREARRREFAAAFPLLGDAVDGIFGRWFDDPAPTHGALAAFARELRDPGPIRHPGAA